jgi:hypothetical protein
MVLELVWLDIESSNVARPFDCSDRHDNARAQKSIRAVVGGQLKAKAERA